MTTYNAAGNQTAPTITAERVQVWGVAVDAAGKIYVANGGFNTVKTYNADGTQTTPTIKAGVYPLGVAIDAAGKIFVLNDGPDLNTEPPTGGAGPRTVTTYNAVGTQTTPTITVQQDAPHIRGIAVH